MHGIAVFGRWLAAGVLALASTASAQYQAPAHTQPTPFLGNLAPEQAAAFADLGLTTERDREPAWQLEIGRAHV